ncbi:hypothetical protein E2C01_030703 [Portunus trituberculatus]|uniref:Uncharacterized protein n=1 Tax=Portunus trituberculatus TaxID=210409 RepID=A0A5B7EW24_PORTR|nr:hypothetical protein [Portunus trituberculatus]
MFPISRQHVLVLFVGSVQDLRLITFSPCFAESHSRLVGSQWDSKGRAGSRGQEEHEKCYKERRGNVTSGQQSHSSRHRAGTPPGQQAGVGGSREGILVSLIIFVWVNKKGIVR